MATVAQQEVSFTSVLGLPQGYVLVSMFVSTVTRTTRVNTKRETWPSGLRARLSWKRSTLVEGKGI